MGIMIEGEWISDNNNTNDEHGRFQREDTVFRDRITADNSGQFDPEPNRYHLYIARGCPWAHRTALMRRLKGLTDVITMDIVAPHLGPEGWYFDPEYTDSTADRVNSMQLLREVYRKADPEFTGRVTVPVLWDKQMETIINNESREIMKMLDRGFDELADNNVTFYPETYRDEIEQVMDEIYQPINNGVYRAGFAETQEAYNEAVEDLFEALDYWESVLDSQRYVCGPVLTAADWCMFTTLWRFDVVYHFLFQCNIRRLRDYPNLWNYLKELYQYPGVRQTCNREDTKRMYFTSQPTSNPQQIIPSGPEIDFEAPHNRDRLEAEPVSSP